MSPSWSLFWFFVASGVAVNAITWVFRVLDRILGVILEDL